MTGMDGEAPISSTCPQVFPREDTTTLFSDLCLLLLPPPSPNSHSQERKQVEREFTVVFVVITITIIIITTIISISTWTSYIPCSTCRGLHLSFHLLPPTSFC